MLTSHSYFENQVRSIGFQVKGQRRSVGVMTEGTYRFDTVAPERMTVVEGTLIAKLPGNIEWQSFYAGDAFEVPGESAFDVKIPEHCVYLCDYL